MRWPGQALAKVALHLDWVVTLGVASSVAILGLSQTISSQTVASATLLVLGAFAIGAIRDRTVARQLGKTLEEMPNLIKSSIRGDALNQDAQTTGLSRVFPQSVAHNWVIDIASANVVSITKLKLNFTENPEYLLAFEEVLARGGKVDIVMADPRCPAMWLRYLEEPRPSSENFTRETAWVRGLDELALEVARLESWRQRIGASMPTRGRLRIALAQHYPTQALYRFDDRVYVFHYPYMERGFHAPMFLFSDPSTRVHQFMIRCQDSIVANSIELDDDVASDVARQYRTGALSDSAVARSEVRIARKRQPRT